jgi:hypothetical protein
VAPVQRQVPLRLRQEHGRQAGRRGAGLDCSRRRSSFSQLSSIYGFVN